MKNKTTCQICGRAIKAECGLIAYHGYKQPRYGFRSTSCLGARYEPYEVSCDRLREVIEMVKNLIVSQEKELEDFLATPPQTLKRVERRSAHGPDELVTYEKPENFIPKERYYGSILHTYEYVYRDRKYEYEQTIKGAKAQLSFMETRLTDWPHYHAVYEKNLQSAKEQQSEPEPAPQPKATRTLKPLVVRVWTVGHKTDKEFPTQTFYGVGITRDEAEDMYREWYTDTIGKLGENLFLLKCTKTNLEEVSTTEKAPYEIGQVIISTKGRKHVITSVTPYTHGLWLMALTPPYDVEKTPVLRAKVWFVGVRRYALVSKDGTWAM